MKRLFPAVCGGLILALAVSIPRAHETAPTKAAAGPDKANPSTSKEAAPDGPAIETRSGDKTNTVRDPQSKSPTADGSDAKRPDAAKDEPKVDESDDKFKIIRLLRASPDSIRKAVIQIYSDEFNHGKLTIMADVRTNAVLLRAPRGLSEKVQELVISLDDFETAARDTASVPDAGEKPEVPTGRAPPRRPYGQAYRQHEDQAGRLAAAYCSQLAATPADRQKLEQLKAELQAEVSAAFEARQESQRADMNRLRGRLAQIERQLDARQQQSQEIINNRINELLHPEKKWEAGDEQASANLEQAEKHAELIRGDEGRGDDSSVSFVDRPSGPLVRDAGANPRRALLDAEAAIATARASLAEADKALVPARELARRISEAAKQGGVAQRQVFSSEAEVAAQEARRERAVINLDQAKRQAVLAREDLAAQVELLKIDLDAAALNLEQASRDEARMRALFAQKAISVEEADVKRLALQQARLQHQRTKTLYDLYRKALPDGGAAGGKKPTDEKSGTKSDDPFGTGTKE